MNILNDAESNPNAFRWNGPMARSVLEQWIRLLGITVPSDQLDLWVETGGGDMYDSETILKPLVGADDIDSLTARNQQLVKKGLERPYLVFQDGVFVSAIRQPDGVIVQLDPETLREVASFRSIVEWYATLIRPEFKDRYRIR